MPQVHLLCWLRPIQGFNPHPAPRPDAPAAYQDIRHHYEEGPDDADIEQERQEYEQDRTCAKCGAVALPVYVGAYDHELADARPFEGIAVVDADGLATEDYIARICPLCRDAFKEMFVVWLTRPACAPGTAQAE